jgi:hypothetical protein
MGDFAAASCASVIKVELTAGIGVLKEIVGQLSRWCAGLDSESVGSVD